MNKIKQNDNMGWNDQGNLTIKGQEVPNTNIIDLVRDVLQKRKTFEPRGWQQFANAIHETNFPQDLLIGNAERYGRKRKIGQEYTPEHTPLQFPTSDDFHTPSRWQVKCFLHSPVICLMLSDKLQVFLMDTYLLT